MGMGKSFVRLLLFVQQQIDDPAAADVLAGLAAVIQNAGVGAAGFFQRVGQDRQAFEGAVVVDRFLFIYTAPCSRWLADTDGFFVGPVGCLSRQFVLTPHGFHQNQMKRRGRRHRAETIQDHRLNGHGRRSQSR